MTDPARGPTTEELRARVLGVLAQAERDIRLVLSRDHGIAVLARPCLACNREQGERMCHLCQRLEEAEAGV